MSILMKAVKAGDAEKVKAVLAEGADVSALDESGDSPIIMAAYHGFTDVLQLLLEAGADVSALDPGMKATALHAAAYAGHAEAARLLTEYGIDLDRQGPYNGYTALHDAVWQNNVDVVRVLIAAGANGSITSHEGQTPLDFARAKNRKHIVALLESKERPAAE